MPLGHLVDLAWRRKALLVYLGAHLIAASLVIMYALIMHTEAMRQVLSVDTWFVVSSLLAPAGYVLQDTVADAMSCGQHELRQRHATDRHEWDGQRCQVNAGVHFSLLTLLQGLHPGKHHDV